MKYFVAVAEELNFTRAAKRLNMAQPPLSQQIKSLEIELGVQLLKRNNRKVELTEPGQVFLEEARNTLLQSEKAIKAAQLAQQGQIGRLTVGFVGSATDGIFINKLKEFHDNYPLVQLTLKEMTTSQQLDALYSREIHVGMLRPFVQETDIQSQVFTEESFVFALPKSHSLASRPKISVHEVANDPFIMPPRHYGPDFYDIINGYFRSCGISIRIIQEAVQMHTIVNLVASGLGISVVPSSVKNFRRPGIVYKNFIEKPPQINLSLAWRMDDKSPALRFFLNHFKLEK
nr:LysR family transcriptional regulator [Paenibacillus apii]